MRRLLYVPIIHDEADLGSVGQSTAQQSAAAAGARRWALHQATLGTFWNSVGEYLRSFEPGLLRIYQDGLAAGGEVGTRVVREAARRGSRNYRLVMELLERGAALRKTEDPALLLAERRRLQEALGGGPRHVEDKLDAPQLLEARDAFIARAIATTLGQGEVGVLFIGAYHRVLERLPEDVSVTAVKEPEEVQAYIRELLLGQNDKRLEELSSRLGAEVPPDTLGQGGQARG